MPDVYTITNTHVKKLGHIIDEIRLRALNNIISKFELGFLCNCDSVKQELINQLFNWFSFDTVPQPGQCLDLLLRLVKAHDNYVNIFGHVRFQNELNKLHTRLDPIWYEKLNEIEDAMLNPNKFNAVEPTQSLQHILGATDDSYKQCNHTEQQDHSLNNVLSHASLLDGTTPFDLTLPHGDVVTVSKLSEGGIKWLAMPWQPLVASDRGVLAAVEEALKNTIDVSLILHTCRFLTNVMLQDFPAEVFLQRPSIVIVLHSLLELCENTFESVIPTVLTTLHKLTRSLIFRIHYYCDPCVANRKQKFLAGKLDNNLKSPSEARHSPDGSIPEANYQAYQSAGTSNLNHCNVDNIDESVLQLQQMFIPTYCIETLKHVVLQLNIPIKSSYQLRNIKYVTNLAYELIQLLNTSIQPSIWLCADGITLKVNEELKALLKSLGEIMNYLGNCSSVDYFRITYLHVVCITMKLLSNLVPLELADTILPKALKMSICNALLDAPIMLMYPTLHTILQNYSHQFKDADEIEFIKNFDEYRVIRKSLQATISILKQSTEQTDSDTINALYAAQLSLPLHKNMSIIKETINFLQHINRYSLNNEDYVTVTKLILSLLANADTDVKQNIYCKCHELVKSILGLECTDNRLSWKNLSFILEPTILEEIICHGTTNESEEIKNFAEDILVYILKGRVLMHEDGWLKLLNAIIPVLPVLQCHAHSSTPLGQCVTKMLDPDVSSNIQLSQLEVLKGNLRLLYSPEYDIRKEATCRLLWFLEKEKDSIKKLPRLSSLHGLPLCSLCTFNERIYLKQLEGNYQKEYLLPVLAMLSESDLDPKVRKSALVQISVMLSDSSLHKVFLEENGLSLILKIFDTALMENDCTNYPDSVIPILAILKSFALAQSLIRHELCAKVDVLLNIVRSIFLFPNNECVKTDGSQLLCLLLYNDYIIRQNRTEANCTHWNISLPYIIVTRMRLPFVCKSHWKISAHRKTGISAFHSKNQALLTFIRQYWAWEWNGKFDMLWKSHSVLIDPNISQALMIDEAELCSFQCSYPLYYCQQQLYKIQNSTTHNGVLCALDYLAMYLKLYKMLHYEQLEIVTTLPWKQTFERFLVSHPTTNEDCDLFINVLNFLQLYIDITKHVGKNTWITHQIRNVTNSLTDLFRNLEVSNHDAHQSILKLARICAAVEKREKINENSKDTWIWFIELIVSTLYFSDHQHFYNLAYLDWLLTCLTHLIGQCQWENHKPLLASLGNALIELIVSFHGAGTVSFMGLSITKNSTICLNQLLHQMQTNFNKKAWAVFWYEEGRSLSWLPMLWQNRDPLVRASALQLLAGLMNAPHTMLQLLNSLIITSTDLCYTIQQFIGNPEESPIVREQACIALSHFVNNCNTTTFQYVDMLETNTILNFVEQCNLYHEISVVCYNIYLSSTLDCDHELNEDTINENMLSVQSIVSGCALLVPRTVSYLYKCNDEIRPLSIRESEIIESDSCCQSIATPSLITAICTLLNDLILIGQHKVISQIYQHSIDKYLLRSFNKNFPGNNVKSLIHYCDILEMYISVCTVLTNSLTHGSEHASVVFSSDSLYAILKFLNLQLYRTETPKVIYLQSKLLTEIFNFITVLSLTNEQHCEPLQVALDLCGKKTVLNCICAAMKASASEVRMSAISCLTFLLSIDVQKEIVGKDNTLLQNILDSYELDDNKNNKSDCSRNIIPCSDQLWMKSTHAISKVYNESERKEGSTDTNSENRPEQSYNSIGAEIGSILLNLFVAHSYPGHKKTRKQVEDKEIITSALSNVFCLSNEAKKVALINKFPKTVLMILKELYVKLNLQPFDTYKNQSSFNKKPHPLIYDINCVFILLMNFMYKNATVKKAFAKQGLADVIHKLWPWIALHNDICTGALKLLSTFTTKCPKAAHSITLTSALPGSGVRKTRNTISLIHVIVQLICKEIDKIQQMFDNHKLHFAFHILRNAVHIHECRDLISKSNLLHFFTKIHPITTKRMKPWPLIEVYCLEFLIDFTYYEEGQLSVSKAIDGLDVLIQLAKCSCSSTKFLAISVLRNLTFNIINRSRFLSSVDFINLLHDMFKHGSLCEIGMAGSMLWPLICNNQKGKLTARSAGFAQSIQEALGSILLLTVGNTIQDKDLTKMLQYIMHILTPSENKNILVDLCN